MAELRSVMRLVVAEMSSRSICICMHDLHKYDIFDTVPMWICCIAGLAAQRLV